MVGGAADLHVGAVGIEIPVRPASAATTAAATHIAVAVRTAALGTAATLTILVHSVISQVSNIAQSGEVRTRLAPHDLAREAVVLSIEYACDLSINPSVAHDLFRRGDDAAWFMHPPSTARPRKTAV